MPVGRHSESKLIGDLLASAAPARTLTIVGSAGIGKTTLLAVAEESAGPDYTVVRCSGVETETQLPFAAVADLLGPLHHVFDDLSPAQAAALRGALALGPPIPGSDLAVAVAVRNVLGLASAECPLLVLVDDTQWLDAPSSSVLAYVARRLEALPVVLIAASRPEATPAWFSGHPRIDLEPLDSEHAHSLLAHAMPDLVTAAADAVVASADGNPLALLELAATLDDDERSGRRSVDLPMHAVGRLGGLYDDRVRALPPATLAALLVAAVATSPSLDVLGPALHAAGLSLADVEVAEEQRLVVLDKASIRFVHPLVRGAVFHVATGPQRRAAHRALIGVAGPDASPWHLAASQPGPDASVSEALADLGRRSVERRAYAHAVDAFDEAARRAGDPDQRVALLDAAADAALHAGNPTRAVALATEALHHATVVDDVSTVHRAKYRLATALAGGNDLEAAHGLLDDLAADPNLEPDLSLLVDADLARVCQYSGRLAKVPVVIARARTKLGSSASPGVRLRVLAHGAAAAMLTGDVAQMRSDLDDIDALVPEAFPHEENGRFLASALFLRAQSDGHHHVSETTPRLIEQAIESGEIAGVPFLRSVLAEAQYRSGMWDDAKATCDAAIAEAREIGYVQAEASARGIAAVIAAGQGDRDRLASAVERLEELCERLGAPGLRQFAQSALGIDALYSGRAAEAARHFDTVIAINREVNASWDPSRNGWYIFAVEAMLAVGRRSDAEELAGRVRMLAERSRGAVSLAMAEYIEGLLERGTDDEVEACFERALAHDEAATFPIFRALYLLRYGEWLRRRGRLDAARPLLRQAEAIFESLHAAPGVSMAVAELRRAGGRRRTAESVPDAVSERERDIAEAVMRGLKNAEIAAQLFVSVKTVEFHLTHLYAKFGVRNRTELARVLARDEGSTPHR